MEPGSSRIPVRSLHQAMDWSLVLASQGIESTIDYAEEESRWELIIPAAELARAVESIRMYRLENRHFGWRQSLPGVGGMFDWTSVLWAGLVAFFYWASAVEPVLQSAGVMSAAKVAQGEWWRLFTAMWLHADLAHLAANLTLGIVLMGLTMGRYGTGVGLLAAHFAGLGGNLVVWWFGSHVPSLGASGAVMGSLGLLGAQSFSWRRSPQHTKRLITGVLGGVMLFVLFGLNPETDVRAHLGGFLSGLGLGAILTLLHDRTKKPGLNVVAALVLLALVLCPWCAALIHGQ